MKRHIVSIKSIIVGNIVFYNQVIAYSHLVVERRIHSTDVIINRNIIFHNQVVRYSYVILE